MIVYKYNPNVDISTAYIYGIVSNISLTGRWYVMSTVFPDSNEFEIQSVYLGQTRSRSEFRLSIYKFALDSLFNFK